MNKNLHSRVQNLLQIDCWTAAGLLKPSVGNISSALSTSSAIILGNDSLHVSVAASAFRDSTKWVVIIMHALVKSNADILNLLFLLSVVPKKEIMKQQKNNSNRTVFNASWQKRLLVVLLLLLLM